jgi:hypothetical protein
MAWLNPQPRSAAPLASKQGNVSTHCAADRDLVLIDSIDLLLLRQPQLIVVQQPAAAGTARIQGALLRTQGCLRGWQWMLPCASGAGRSAQQARHVKCYTLAALCPVAFTHCQLSHLMRMAHCSSSSSAYRRARCREGN